MSSVSLHRATPRRGAAVDRQNFALSAGGVEPASCAWDEIELAVEHGEAPPTHCLRFSVGIYEAGEGRLELQLDGYDGGFAGHGDVTQRIHGPGGRIEERNAGRWEFHKTHGHPHYLGFVRYELDQLRFDAAGRPVLSPAGGSAKTGYNTADQRIADWTSFAQDPAVGGHRQLPEGLHRHGCRMGGPLPLAAHGPVRAPQARNRRRRSLRRSRSGQRRRTDGRDHHRGQHRLCAGARRR